MTRKKQPVDPRAHSRLVTDGVAQTPARAMLRAVGYVDGDFDKVSVGVASPRTNWNITVTSPIVSEPPAADSAARQSRRAVSNWAKRPKTSPTLSWGKMS